MSHNIEPYDHYTEGEYIRWEFTVTENGSAKSLIGASVEWHLLDSQGDLKADAVLTDSDSGVSMQITDGANGAIELEIESDATSDMADEYWHRVVVTDSNGRVEKWGGEFDIDHA